MARIVSRMAQQVLLHLDNAMRAAWRCTQSLQQIAAGTVAGRNGRPSLLSG